MYKKAFTLVELIVVITILAVLGTISFISLNGYSSNARDSKRVSDMNSIEKTLVFDFTKNGKYQDPENYTTITNSGEIITKQGIVGINLLGKLGVGETAKDPLYNEYYTYSTDKDNRKMQLLGFLENSEDGSKFISTTEAKYENLSTMFIKLEGDELGILLDLDTYKPVKGELNGTSLELQTDGINYKSIVNYTEIYSGEKITNIIPNRDCKRLKEYYDYKESGIYTINPSGDNEFEVYCDMITDGGGWTRTHLLHYDTIPNGHNLVGNIGMFSDTQFYGSGQYRMDIENLPFKEFAYLTAHTKENIEYLSNGEIKTVGYKSEGFSKWMEKYRTGDRSEVRPVWYYYTSLDKQNRESIAIGARNGYSTTGYRNMGGGGRLLSGSNGTTATTWAGTNMPFGRRSNNYSNNTWCYGGKNECSKDQNDEEQKIQLASLWIR